MPLLPRLFRAIARRLPPGELAPLILSALAECAARLPPKEALQLLFRVDGGIYAMSGRQAVRLGGGVHTKHRHTGYHQFFARHIPRGATVLDVGSGIGALARDLAEQRDARVTGVELSPDNVARAQQLNPHPHVTYLTGDIRQAIPPGPFQVVILSNVLEHLPQRPQLLQRLVAATNAGRVIIRVPLFERDWRVPLRKELGLEWRLDPTHETEYTLESFQQEMVDAGLVALHQEVHWGEIWAVLQPRRAARTGATAATLPPQGCPDGA